MKKKSMKEYNCPIGTVCIYFSNFQYPQQFLSKAKYLPALADIYSTNTIPLTIPNYS